MSQMEKVNCRYGAPMGRHSRHVAVDDIKPRSVCLFRVRIDSQGYDDGGAYWGIGEPLWCVTDGADYREFLRARSRFAAWVATGLPMSALRVPAVDERYTVTREWYGAATPGFIARFCSTWINHAATRDEAWELCRQYEIARMVKS